MKVKAVFEMPDCCERCPCCDIDSEGVEASVCNLLIFADRNGIIPRNDNAYWHNKRLDNCPLEVI